eukprot:5389308-Ditylum_brightwellii.AAC.1
MEGEDNDFTCRKTLGRYKALLSCSPDGPHSDAEKEMREKQDLLIGVHVDLLNYALKQRYSFD